MFQAKRVDDFLKLLCAGLFVVFLFLVFFHPIETEDVWGHLSAARWIFETHQVPHDEIFTSSPDKAPWIFNQWLGSCIYYVVYLIGGFLGLKVFLVAIFFIIFGIFYWQAREKIPFVWLLALLFVMTPGLETRAFSRPLVFNFMFIQIFLILLFHHQRDPKSRRIYILPALSAVWFNLHMGSFTYGAPLIGIFLLSAVVRYVDLAFKKKQQSTDGDLTRKELKHLAVVLAGHYLAFFVNPYGIEGAISPFAMLVDPGSLGRRVLYNRILEFLPPAYIFYSLAGAWVFILILLVVFCLVVNKRGNFTNLVLFAFSLFLFLYGRRASELFVLVCGYIIIETAGNMKFQDRWIHFKKSKAIIRLVYGIFMLVLMANIIHLANQKVVLNQRTVRNIQLLFDAYNPADAVSLLKKNHIEGKVFNWGLYGGYILWAGYPTLEPFVDGRNVNEEKVMDSFRMRSDPPRYWLEKEKQYGLAIALLDANFSGKNKVLDYLAENSDWQLIFVKGTTVVFVKKGVYKIPSELNEYAQKLKSETIPPEVFSVLLSPQEPGGFIKEIVQFLNPPPSYIEPLEEGVALWGLGFREAAVGRMWEAVRLTSDAKAKRILSLALEEIKKEKK